jgi:hypothetical protein
MTARVTSRSSSTGPPYQSTGSFRGPQAPSESLTASWPPALQSPERGSNSLSFGTLQRRHSDEPHEEQGAAPAPVPLAGFLNPSAVSWQVRAARPYLMPLPLLGFPFRAFPSRRSRAPLGAACCPAVVHRRARTHLPSACHPWFHRLAPRRSPGSSKSYGFPFHDGSICLEDLVASRSPWPSSGLAAPYRQLHRLRSFVPFVSPFAPARVSPDRRSLLSWSSASRKRSSSLGTSNPSGCPDTTHADNAGHDDEEPQPPASGADSPAPKDRLDPLGTTQSGVDWRAPPLDGVPSPLTLFRSAHRPALAFGASK